MVFKIVGICALTVVLATNSRILVAQLLRLMGRS
jgi:hypothetical protein